MKRPKDPKLGDPGSTHAAGGVAVEGSGESGTGVVSSRGSGSTPVALGKNGEYG
jgi:hypothetical protein